MQITPQLAVYVLLLIPGLLGHAVFCALTYTAKPSWSGRTVVAVLLSALSYVSLALLRTWPLLSWLPDPMLLLGAADGGIAAAASTNSLLCVVVACSLATIFAVIVVAAHNHRTLFRIAQYFGLTTKSGFESEWDSCMILRARTRWVMLMMKDGTAFTGWLESHDVATGDRAIVLSKVREYDKEGISFEWNADELLYMNSLVDVRAIRLIPNTEPEHESISTRTETSAASQDRDQVREYKPESGTAGLAAGVANQAVGPNTINTVIDRHANEENGDAKPSARDSY